MYAEEEKERRVEATLRNYWAQLEAQRAKDNGDWPRREWIPLIKNTEETKK